MQRCAPPATPNRCAGAVKLRAWLGMPAELTQPYACRICCHALLQIGNLQGAAQLLSKASGSLSGTAADLLSPARMVVIGTLLTALCKPMFALRQAAAAGWSGSCGYRPAQQHDGCTVHAAACELCH